MLPEEKPLVRRVHPRAPVPCLQHRARPHRTPIRDGSRLPGQPSRRAPRRRLEGSAHIRRSRAASSHSLCWSSPCRAMPSRVQRPEITRLASEGPLVRTQLRPLRSEWWGRGRNASRRSLRRIGRPRHLPAGRTRPVFAKSRSRTRFELIQVRPGRRYSVGTVRVPADLPGRGL
jgi:hypothetical protein